jgi:hypothetical protein
MKPLITMEEGLRTIRNLANAINRMHEADENDAPTCAVAVAIMERVDELEKLLLAMDGQS